MLAGHFSKKKENRLDIIRIKKNNMLCYYRDTFHLPTVRKLYCRKIIYLYALHSIFHIFSLYPNFQSLANKLYIFAEKTHFKEILPFYLYSTFNSQFSTFSRFWKKSTFFAKSSLSSKQSYSCRFLNSCRKI